MCDVVSDLNRRAFLQKLFGVSALLLLSPVEKAYSQTTPDQIGALTNWSHVSAGYAHSTAIKTDGTLWAWGSGGNGQLGTGTSSSRSSPVQIGTPNNWSKVSGGRSHSGAITNP